MPRQEVVQNHAGVDHARSELVLRVAGPEQKSPAILPSAEGLLHEEARGRLAKVEPELLCGLGVEVGVHKGITCIARPAVGQDDPSLAEPKGAVLVHGRHVLRVPQHRAVAAFARPPDVSVDERLLHH